MTIILAYGPNSTYFLTSPKYSYKLSPFIVANYWSKPSGMFLRAKIEKTNKPKHIKNTKNFMNLFCTNGFQYLIKKFE